LTDASARGIDEQFKQAVAKKHFKKNDIDAGREYVEAYVQYIHYVERLFQAIERPAEGHYHEADVDEPQHTKH
jgi:hypothetical protein